MKVAWKIALYNLVFHQLPLIQHCSIFYKKMLFRVPHILGEFNGKICSECISYNLEFLNFPGEDVTPSLALPLLCLRRSVRASGTQLSYFINWDSYFNSFWEPWLPDCLKKKQFKNKEKIKTHKIAKFKNKEIKIKPEQINNKNNKNH